MAIEAKGKTIGYDEIRNKLSKIPVAALLEKELFLKGDHWQKGAQWNGYIPNPEDDEGGRTWRTIERAFTPKNNILGIVSRIVGAIFGKAPDFALMSANAPEPSAAPGEEPARELTDEEKRFADYDRLIVEWMDKRGGHEALKLWVANYVAYGKAALRIYVPSGYLSGNKISGTFEQCLNKIYIDVPHYSLFKDELDPNFGEKYTLLEIKTEQDKSSVFEVCYVDPETNDTILRQVAVPVGNQMNVADGTNPQMTIKGDGERRSEKNEDLVTAKLGGNLLTYIAGEYEDAIISKTVIRQQNTVNMAKTAEVLAANNINFPDTTFINADIPETEDVKQGNQTVTRRRKIPFGAGVWRAIFGVTTSDEAGNEQIATPDVKFRDQADPEKFAKIAENNTRDMFQDAGMLYIYLASSPYPSGDSRAEAMTDYLILLIALKTLCEQVGKWLITTVVRLAMDFAGESDDIEAFNVIFSSKVTIGRVTNEDKQTMLDEVEKGLRSIRNYQIAAEVTDDPDGEMRAYLVERKNGWHDQLETAMKSRELDQTKELAEMSNKAQIEMAKNRPAPNASGAGAGA